jgi:hypothetical protein
MCAMRSRFRGRRGMRGIEADSVAAVGWVERSETHRTSPLAEAFAVVVRVTRPILRVNPVPYHAVER